MSNTFVVDETKYFPKNIILHVYLLYPNTVNCTFVSVILCMLFWFKDEHYTIMTFQTS